MVDSNVGQSSSPNGVQRGVGTGVDLLTSMHILESLVEALIEGDSSAWGSLSLQQAREMYTRLESARNRLVLVDAQFMHAFDKELPLMDHKRCQWLNRECGVAMRDARERIQAARRIYTGAIDARLEDGTDDGTISRHFMPQLSTQSRTGHAGQYAVSKVDRAIRSLPAKVQDEATKAADEPVAKLIAQGGPNTVDDLAMQLRRLIDEDEYDDSDRARLRGITISKQGADGMSSIRGKVTPRFAAALQRLFADHAKAGDLADRMGHKSSSDSEDANAAFDSLSDPRSPEQRRHDALEAAVFGGFNRLSPRKATGGSSGADDRSSQLGEEGTPADSIPALKTDGLLTRRGSTTIVAVTTLQELLQGHGDAFTDGGIHCSLESLIGGTECNDLYLQILDLEGQTLHLGRSRRLGSLSQYLALLGEERISTAPGTSAPAAFCDIHHIKSWESGGGTDLDNLTLVDKHVHSQTDDAKSRKDKWRSYSPREHAPNSGQTTTRPPKVRWEPPDGHRVAGESGSNLHPDAKPRRWKRPGVA